MQNRRVAERAGVALPCTLRRTRGAPVQAKTLDVGPGGMRVTSSRPLRTDEVFEFDLPLPPAGAEHVEGQARVLRQQRRDVYALRFEQLTPMCERRLRALAAALAAPPGSR